MKKFVPVLLLCLFLQIAVNAQDVPEKQQALISKVTASWCSNCGTWGWNLFSGLVQDNSNDAVLMAVHYSGNLINPTATAITNNFKAIGQPMFFLGNDNQSATSSNVAAKRNEIKDKVANLASQSPVANTGLLANLAGDELTVTAKTKFFQATTGAYYMAIYIIEDGVIGFQSNQGNNASHKKVLRSVMTTDAFGSLLMDGNITAGSEFSHNHTITLNPSWNTSSLELAAVIWKKDGNTYNFVNTNSTSDLTIANINNPQALGNNMTVQPNISEENMTIQLKIANRSEHAHLRLYNLKGQLLRTIYSGRLDPGQRQFQLLRSQTEGTGMYLLTLATEQGLVSRKVVFK